MFKNVKSGFSLVELSLVLIIVSLIVSAVISGKSLITNAKLTVLNSEMQTLRIAFGGFVSDNGTIDYTKISLYDLMDQGYLDTGTVLCNDGENKGKQSTTASEKDIYKSKLTGAAWNYVGKADAIAPMFGATSDPGNVGYLDTNAANSFVKKYERKGSIEITLKDIADSNKKCLIVDFKNGAQG